MSFRAKMSKGETVECMVIENGGRSINRDKIMQHVGSLLHDSFLQEYYSIVTKPLLSYKKGKAKPVYLVDRDSGVTVYIERQETGKKTVQTFVSTEDKPLDIVIDGKKYAGQTVILERSEILMTLTTVPRLIGRAIESKMIGDNFSAPLSGREKMIMLLVGIIIGGFIGLMF